MPPKVKPQATGDISEQLTFGPGVITKLLFHSIAISFVPVSLFYLIAFDWLDRKCTPRGQMSRAA